MSKLTIRLIVALLTFLLGIAATALWLTKRSSVEDMPQKNVSAPVAQEKQELRLVVPDNTWVPIFFESINERAGVARLPKLGTAILPKDDLEARVWAGFGVTALEGFVLKRTAGRWSATHLEGIHPRLPRSEYQKKLQTPKSGWDACWQRLVDAGILRLPDASEVQCNTGVLDGMSYVVEFNVNSTYRTYMYDNPDYAKCSEAKQMIGIVKIIGEEFSLQEFNIKE
jgi:hypothetical protein